jgi:hypothetical protein
MIDQAAAFAGLFCPDPARVRRAVTLDLDCRFTGQAAIGTRLSAEGRVVAAGRNVFFARTEVFDAEGHAGRLRRLHPPLPRRQRRPRGRAGVGVGAAPHSTRSAARSSAWPAGSDMAARRPAATTA